MLLREIIKYCRDRDIGSTNTVAVTASTGIASVNIGGVTIHSWAGIGLGKDDAKKIFFKHMGNDKRQRKEQNSSKVVARWRAVRTLILDESQY